MTNTWIAKYRGYCENCPSPIEVDDECVYIDVPGGRRAISHAVCPEQAEDLVGPVCPKCHLELPKSGVCC